MTTYDCLQYAFMSELMNIVNFGEEIEVRGSKVKEILNRCITITNPWKRCLFVGGRNDNIFAKIAETLWMLSGRDDITWLSRYVPRAADYSDDGKTWRGAYGPRLRKWTGDAEQWRLPVDQLAFVVNLLREDPYTRRAVMTLWDPGVDTESGKDIPCNNWLHFYIREGKLYLNVAQRSSDILWGFSGIDVFQWSVLLDVVAASVVVLPGSMTYFISNLHMYEQHWKRGDGIISGYKSEHNVYNYGLLPPDLKVPFECLDADLEKVFILEESFREDVPCNNCDYPDDDFLRECVNMLQAYNLHLNRKGVDYIATIVSSMKTFDFKFAAIEYFNRNIGYAFLKELFLSPEERAIVEIMCK